MMKRARGLCVEKRWSDVVKFSFSLKRGAVIARLCFSALKEDVLSLPQAFDARKAKLLMTDAVFAAEKAEYFAFHFGRRS